MHRAMRKLAFLAADEDGSGRGADAGDSYDLVVRAVGQLVERFGEQFSHAPLGFLRVPDLIDQIADERFGHLAIQGSNRLLRDQVDLLGHLGREVRDLVQR